MSPLLEVRQLETRFSTKAGVVQAVNGVSFTVNEGETVGVVGESGSGKSVTMLSVARLLPSPPGKITGGEVMFEGRDLLKLKDEEMRSLRGDRLAMIFQDPMTSLNPVLRVEKQLTEVLRLHRHLNREHAKDQAVELLELVGIPGAGDRTSLYENPLHPYTKALMSAVPIPDPEIEAKRERIVLKGDVPSPTHPPSGCRFHTRCPWAIEECKHGDDPEFRDVGGGHYVACILVE